MQGHYDCDVSDDEQIPLLPQAGETIKRTTKAPSSSIAKGAKAACKKLSSSLANKLGWKPLCKCRDALRSSSLSSKTKSKCDAATSKDSNTETESRDEEKTRKAAEADRRHMKHASDWAFDTQDWIKRGDARRLNRSQLQRTLEFTERFGADFTQRRARRREAADWRLSVAGSRAEQMICSTLVALQTDLRSAMAQLNVSD